MNSTSNTPGYFAAGSLGEVYILDRTLGAGTACMHHGHCKEEPEPLTGFYEKLEYVREYGGSKSPPVYTQGTLRTQRSAIGVNYL